MSLIEAAKNLLHRQEEKDTSKNLLLDLVSSVLGDPVALARVMKSIIASPFFIGEQLFWQNFELFLKGVDSDANMKIKLSKKLTNSTNKEENAKRIIRIIDKLDTIEKVEYMVNATRAFCLDKLDKDEYFRVCLAIENCYINDLNYNDTKRFPESITVYGLSSICLM